jgi:hypothetical protein
MLRSILGHVHCQRSFFRSIGLSAQMLEPQALQPADKQRRRTFRAMLLQGQIPVHVFLRQ